MKNLDRIIKKVLREEDKHKSKRYMFFSNLEQMRRQCDLLLDLDEEMVESILENGHDWAQDHIAEAKNNMDQVFDFIMNESKSEDNDMFDYDDEVVMESKKKKNVAINKKLWQQSLVWAKQRYDVCPSAYCNGAAVKDITPKEVNGLKNKLSDSTLQRVAKGKLNDYKGWKCEYRTIILK